MKYTFKDILDSSIYTSSRVMFATGKYEIFNNMVADTVKELCKPNESLEFTSGASDEFGLQSDVFNTNILDYDTFMAVVNTKCISGLWYCRADLKSLSKKQIAQLERYLKAPSDNGKLVITSTEFKEYLKYMKNKLLNYGNKTHILNLSFPDTDNIHVIVKQMFNEHGKYVDSNVINYFCIRMSKEYDDYDVTIDNICNSFKDKNDISIGEIKEEMRGIENFDLDDLFNEVVKPISSDKTNNKKILRMIVIITDQLGAENLVKKLLTMINEEIDFRVMINKGIIPIRIDYFMSEVHRIMDKLTPLVARDEKYKKYYEMNEWQFRKKANLAAQTSLKDWACMKMILSNINLRSASAEIQCQKALYALVVRSKVTEEQLKNDMGLVNLIDKQFNEVKAYKIKGKE